MQFAGYVAILPKKRRQAFEDSPRQAAGNLHRKDDNSLDIRSLTPQQATGNALAYAVQPLEIGRSALSGEAGWPFRLMELACGAGFVSSIAEFYVNRLPTTGEDTRARAFGKQG
jgi:hypothetical protein